MITLLGIFLAGSLGLFVYNFIKPRRRGLPFTAKYIFPAVALISTILLFSIRGGPLVAAIIIMAYSFVGMLFCARYQRSYANAQNLAIGLLIVVLICMSIILTKTLGSGETQWLIENELKYAKSAAIVFGKRLAKKYPGKTALIITDEFFEKSKRQQEIISGLEEGFGDKIKIGAIDFPKPPKPKGMPEDMPYMMIEMMSAADFDKVIDAHKDCDLIVSLIGLPRDVAGIKIWRMPDEKRPKVALFFAEHYNLKNAIMADYIIILTYRPGVKFTKEPCPNDPEEAFNQRYIIVDADNVDKIDKKYKNFFAQ